MKKMKKFYLLFLTLFSVIVTNSQQLVNDLYTGITGSSPSDLIEFEGKLYYTGRFQSSGLDQGNELVSYNPANGGINTKGLYAGFNSSDPEEKTVYNGKLYFSARASSGQKNLYFLVEGTGSALVITKIAPNTSSDYKPSAKDLTVVNGKLYFSGNDGANASLRYLHVYDDATSPTATPPYFRVNITGESNTANFNPRNLVKIGNVLYFIAEHSTDGTRVFYYDTVNASSGYLNSISSPENMVEYAGNIYLKGNLTAASQFIKVDVTNSNAITLLSGNPDAPKSSNIVGHSNVLYYTTDNGTSLNGLGIYDLNNNTYRFNNTVPNNSQITNIVKYGSKIYFEAFFTDKGLEMAEFDTATKAIKGFDIRAGSSNGRFLDGYVLNGNLYFLSTDNSAGAELFKYDGTRNVPEIFTSTTLNGAGNDWALLSNWSNGLPNENNEVFIPSGKNAISSLTSMKAKRLVIENGGTLTLNSNTFLDITTGLTNNGNITLDNTAKIKVNGNALNSSGNSIILKKNASLDIVGNITNVGLLCLHARGCSIECPNHFILLELRKFTDTFPCNFIICFDCFLN